MTALALLDIIDPGKRGTGDDLVVLAFVVLVLLAARAWLDAPLKRRRM